MADVVERLHQEFVALVTYLDAGAEPSLRSTADETFRKALLLAAASYFESTLTEIILTFCRDSTHPETLVPELVRHKALSRQYHTLFDWEKTNANRFFALFGEGFKAYVQSAIKADAALDSAIRAFLEVGSERNRLVHMDYGSYTLEKTAEEIFSLFSTARYFLEHLRPLLDAYAAKEAADGHPEEGAA